MGGAGGGGGSVGGGGGGTGRTRSFGGDASVSVGSHASFSGKTVVLGAMPKVLREELAWDEHSTPFVGFNWIENLPVGRAVASTSTEAAAAPFTESPVSAIRRRSRPNSMRHSSSSIRSARSFVYRRGGVSRKPSFSMQKAGVESSRNSVISYDSDFEDGEEEEAVGYGMRTGCVTLPYEVESVLEDSDSDAFVNDTVALPARKRRNASSVYLGMLGEKEG
ncbi:hypothetical protein HDU98_002151 [Podochytrium sp. JEL0797]|nr:hypothetical protein HDU98_002151 [Podochytrium sp. JEL0797]